jgi:rhamnogalacturonan endolyase
VFQVHETPSAHGIELHDARSGRVLWGVATARDTGRGLAADIDPRHPGLECWAGGTLYSCRGEVLGAAPRSVNFALWWDGDLLRELLDGVRIDKWDWQRGELTNLFTASGCAANNGTKQTPCLQADLLGDWREEVVWRACDDTELRIYATPHPTEQRLPTLMHDPVYRLGIAWQNVSYNQPPHTGFFLGAGMAPPARPAIPPDPG